ncbi:hypothetical protein DVA67_010655 [Solirubrobacter sp. CPCC 204708]|uniref:Uncharacterized protein n=1 Tax=Solirubrobacter deserti TaxID=2282478 RepID=A0ABT4RSS1_9ACTN|nr:hypothetical protein [Solirubrobacter deserti]MBE2316438.1 hypothetical protein [Solirubrobacter deserti]MDA0141641.1 hypothetical protein [Solirubrobacter deserti]
MDRGRMCGAPARPIIAVVQRAFAIVSLLIAAAVGAELLAAYNDTTGRPLALLGNLVFFAALYGCPALLIREYARRTGRGWPAIVLLSAAAGLVQAGLLDQSLFAERYGEVRGWEASFRATAIEPLGVSAYMAQGFVLGHVVYSFCAPIALVEAMVPSIARTGWLGRGGVVAATLLWALVAAAIVADSGHATLPELVATLALIGVLVAGAARAGRARGAGTPRARTALAVGLLAATAHALMPATWAGTAGALVVAAAAGVWVARREWDLRSAAALAVGALLSRGALAFTYFPVVGETPAGAKYAHNVGMLALLAVAGAYALRPLRPRRRSSPPAAPARPPGRA